MLGVMCIHIIEHGLGFTKLQEGLYVWHDGSPAEFIIMCASSVA